MWLKYAVSVFRRFSSWYFGISHFFLWYCRIGYPQMSPSLSQNFYVESRAGKCLCTWLEWFPCGQEIWRQILEKCQSPLHAQPHHPLPLTLKEKCGPLSTSSGVGTFGHKWEGLSRGVGNLNLNFHWYIVHIKFALTSSLIHINCRKKRI